MGRRLQQGGDYACNGNCADGAACAVGPLIPLQYRVAIPPEDGFEESELAQVEAALANAMPQLAAATGATNGLCSASNGAFTQGIVEYPDLAPPPFPPGAAPTPMPTPEETNNGEGVV